MPRGPASLATEKFEDVSTARELRVNSIPARPPTPEEEAVQAMLPFVALSALLIVCALGVVRLMRAVKNFRSEAVVRRLREERAARKSREERQEEDRRLQRDLHYACSSFKTAAFNLNDCRDVAFSSVNECITLIPELVRARRLEPGDARLIERNVGHLLVVEGMLRTKDDD